MSGSYDEASEEVTDSFWEVSGGGLGSCLSPDSTHDLSLAPQLLGLSRIPSVKPATEVLRVGWDQCPEAAPERACNISQSGIRPFTPTSAIFHSSHSLPSCPPPAPPPVPSVWWAGDALLNQSWVSPGTPQPHRGRGETTSHPFQELLRVFVT